MDIDQTIEMFERVEEGSRELDARFHCVKMGWEFGNYLTDAGDVATVRGRNGDQSWTSGLPQAHCPHYTTNLQDAVDAIPEGCSWMVATTEGGGFSALIADGTAGGGDIQIGRPSPALSLCLAILKALKAQQEG